jgi:hypothetical protein
VLNLYHTEVIHSSVVDWIEPITLEKHNLQLFSVTECVLNNILKNTIIVSNMTGSIFTTCYYFTIYCGCKWSSSIRCLLIWHKQNYYQGKGDIGVLWDFGLVVTISKYIAWINIHSVDHTCMITSKFHGKN